MDGMFESASHTGTTSKKQDEMDATEGSNGREERTAWQILLHMEMHVCICIVEEMDYRAVVLFVDLDKIFGNVQLNTN